MGQINSKRSASAGQDSRRPSGLSPLGGSHIFPVNESPSDTVASTVVPGTPSTTTAVGSGEVGVLHASDLPRSTRANGRPSIALSNEHKLGNAEARSGFKRRIQRIFSKVLSSHPSASKAPPPKAQHDSTNTSNNDTTAPVPQTSRSASVLGSSSPPSSASPSAEIAAPVSQSFETSQINVTALPPEPNSSGDPLSGAGPSSADDPSRRESPSRVHPEPGLLNTSGKGKQKEVILSDVDESGPPNDEPEIRSSVDDELDSLLQERIAAKRTIIEAMQDDPSADPDALERMVDGLTASDTAETSRHGASNSTSGVSPADVPVVPVQPNGIEPTRLDQLDPSPQRRALPTIGTTMLVQGVTATPRPNRNTRGDRSFGNLRSMHAPRSSSTGLALERPDSSIFRSSGTGSDNTRTRSPPTLNDSAEGIDVLTMLLGVVTAATGASLMNGSLLPEVPGTSNAGSTSATATPSGPVSPLDSLPVSPTSDPSQPTLSSAPSSTSTPTSRRRRLLHSMRSRLFGDRSRPSAPASSTAGDHQHSSSFEQNYNVPASSSSSERPPNVSLEALRASLSQQVARALARSTMQPLGSSFSAPSLAADAPVDPANVPLPPDDDGLNEVGAEEDATQSGTNVLPAIAAPIAIGSQSSTENVRDDQGSFEQFVTSIQADLRSTLVERQRIERLRRERGHTSNPSSSLHSRSPSSHSPGHSSEPYSPPDLYLSEHIPSVDNPLRWFRVFRFPAVAVPGDPSEPNSPPMVPSVSRVEDITSSPFSRQPLPNEPSVPERVAPPVDVRMSPVIVVRVQQQRLDMGGLLDEMAHTSPSPLTGSSTERTAPSASPNLPHSSPSSPLEPPSPSSLTANAPSSRPSNSTESMADEDMEELVRQHRASQGTARPRPEAELEAMYGDSWRDHVRSFITSHLARGAAERQRAQLAVDREQRARRTAPESDAYVISVVGGYYPEEVALAPLLLTGQFDHDDLWALAELLGQVKPPVASKEEIEKSGLQIIKAQDVIKHEKAGQLASNTVERCLICLSEYEEDEEVRILSCKHAFHKECVDKWMETGRNNCPACRTKGVPSQPPTADASPT